MIGIGNKVINGVTTLNHEFYNDDNGYTNVKINGGGGRIIFLPI